jgi:ABC-type nitrate/sulfonate/bicarbonate transport system ATPase subunit
MNFSFKESLLYVENLAVELDGKVIIKNINLIEKNVVRENVKATGQIIAIIGRSGRGKSTFFKTLTGLYEPTEGKILIKDFTSNEENAAKTVKEGDIGFVDQKYTLFRHKTVRQIFNFALRKSDLSETEKAKKINDYIKNWGLDSCAEKYPNELSGGQRQRTAIIEQLFSSDRFIVLDEPFSGLDVGNIKEVKDAFNLLVDSNEHNTILFSTHDIELAIEIAQSIYIIGFPTENGNLKDYGTFVANYDLREMGLAWREYGDQHRKLYKEIVDEMMKS